MIINNEVIPKDSTIIRRSWIIIPVVFIIGLLIYFLKDKNVGIAIMIGGVLSLIFLFVYRFKIKQGDTKGAKRISYSLNVVTGLTLLIIGSILVILSENFNDGVFGYVTLIVGISMLKDYFKNIPWGMKAILILFYLGVLSSFKSLIFNFKSPNLILGFFVDYPISSMIHILLLIFDILVIIAILKKVGWKLILLYRGFGVVDSLAMTIWILYTPLSESVLKFNVKLSNTIDIQSLGVYENIGKAITAIPMFIGLIIGVAIWIYIYRKKEYFSNVN